MTTYVFSMCKNTNKIGEGIVEWMLVFVDHIVNY